MALATISKALRIAIPLLTAKLGVAIRVRILRPRIDLSHKFTGG